MKSTLSKLAASRALRIGVGLTLSGAFLYLAARDVDFAEAWQTILEARAAWVALALISVAANTLGKAIRWKALLGPTGKALPLGRLLAALLAGQMLNNLSPVRVGDLSRVVQVGGMGPGRSHTLGTVAIEKLLDLLAYALLLLTILFLIPIPTWVSSSAYTLAATAVFFALLVAAITRWREKVTHLLERATHWLPPSVQAQAANALRSGMGSLQVLRHRPTMLRVIFWSILIWGTAVLTNHLALQALRISLPVTAPLLLLLALQAGISIPAVPGRIGIFEYLCVLSLGFFGVGRAQAFGYGILLHAIVSLPTNLIGLLAFWFLGMAGQEPARPQALGGR